VRDVGERAAVPDRPQDRPGDRDAQRVPVCRPAEASEVATPAIERGMPATAVLVIGELMVPWNTP
jgi:hypothetical protein